MAKVTTKKTTNKKSTKKVARIRKPKKASNQKAKPRKASNQKAKTKKPIKKGGLRKTIYAMFDKVGVDKVTYDQCEKLAKKTMPATKFNKAHFAWYKNDYGQRQD